MKKKPCEHPADKYEVTLDYEGLSVSRECATCGVFLASYELSVYDIPEEMVKTLFNFAKDNYDKKLAEAREKLAKREERKKQKLAGKAIGQFLRKF